MLLFGYKPISMKERKRFVSVVIENGMGRLLYFHILDVIGKKMNANTKKANVNMNQICTIV